MKFASNILYKLFVIYIFIIFFEQNRIIQVDNIINEFKFQNNQNFSNYTSKYKVIALYYPNININHNNFEKTENYINEDYLIENQIKLAKSHGIFGFGIMYDLIYIYNQNETILNIISLINKFNFPFFIILNENVNYKSSSESFLIENLTNLNKSLTIILDIIKKYFKSENYINYKGKYILGIYHHSNIYNDIIKNIDNYQMKKDFVNFFLLSIINDYNYLSYTNSTIIKFLSKDIDLADNTNRIYYYNIFYYNLINKEKKHYKHMKNFEIVLGSNPMKFYVSFTKYLNELNNNNETLILFNAWNN